MRALFVHTARQVRWGLWLGVALYCGYASASFSHGQGDAGPIAEVREALERGAYAIAEREARKLAALEEARHGTESLEFARIEDLLVQALVRSGHSGAPDTLALAERVVRLKEQIVGSDHLETACSLHNLGGVHFGRGEFAAASSLHDRALAIRRRQLDPNDPAVADSLDLLASAFIRTERFEDARRLLVQSHSIRESISKKDPIALARTLELTGWLERYTGHYDAAVPLVERARDIRREIGPRHPDVAANGELRGDLMWLRGDRSGARAVWSDALALASHSVGGEHPLVGVLERKVAMAAWAFGDQREARRLREHALQIADASQAPCDADRPKILNDLAISYEHSAEYSAAYQMLKRALSLYERCLGPNHSLVATLMSNQADLASLMGDLRESERLHRRVVTARSTALGANHPFVAGELESLAGVVESLGNRAQAQSLYERALAIRRRAQGEDHPDAAWTLTSLSRVRFDSGNVSQATLDLARAMEIYRRIGSVAEQQPDRLARALDLRAEIEARRGDYAAAHATLEEALEIREEIFGEHHPRSAQTRVELASKSFVLGINKVAFQTALEAERDGRDHLRYTIRYLPERLAMMYVTQHARGLDLALSIAAADRGTDLSNAFDAVIQSRGVVLDELAARTSSVTSADAEITSLKSTLTLNRERFANLMLRSLREDDSVPRAFLDEARRQKEDAERAFAERSAAARADLARVRAGFTDVRRSLPAQSALVSFVRYDRTIVLRSAERTTLRTTPSYIAFVTRSDSDDVAAIPLGSVANIDAVVRAWRGQAADPSLADPDTGGESAYRTAGIALRRRVWDPIAAHLGAATHVFIVPDGTLNLVSFATLPMGARGYLAESARTIHYMSTERDLLPSEGPEVVGGLLAVGGATFDSKPTNKKTPPVVTTDARRAACGSLASVRFEDLPGTRDEVADIGRIWSSSSKNPLTILTGNHATETTVKHELAGRQIIHLATHGFFLGSGCESAPSGTRAVGGVVSPQRSAPAQDVDNPLLLSGIALAGANNHVAARAAEDDGILTAEEVASLNLQSTQWAVLSACDTGVGEIRAGEGVFGLRRAFQIAGAKTVIMSLWSVDDQATRQWMRALYRNRLEKRMNTADAVHDATISVLRDHRARGQSTHPFYWGAFVAAGDWR